MLVGTGLKFEFDKIEGNKELVGPVLSFHVKYTYQGTKNKESTIYFGIRGAKFSTLVAHKDISVGPLDTGSFHILPVAKSGSGTLEFKLRLSAASLQELSKIAKERIFTIKVDLFSHAIEGPHNGSYSGFINIILSSPSSSIVQGKINSNDNTQSFQIPLESWLSALRGTGYLDHSINTLIVNSTDREDIHDLMEKIHEANDLMVQGKPGDSLSKLRDIITWAGRKRKSEKNRYKRLMEYSLAEKERDDVISLLDTLWEWTSHGHHQGLNGDTVDEDQAKAAIDLCYVFVGLLSRRRTVSALPYADDEKRTGDVL